jgi:hypothetical protein
MLIPNIIILALSGFYVIFFQYKYSKDVWFDTNVIQTIPALSDNKENE